MIAHNAAGADPLNGLRPGEIVVIQDGPFEGYEAIFDSRLPGNERWRNHFTHTISIEDGLIRHVHGAMFYAPPTQPVPNWPPYDGNFPLTFDSE